VYDCTHALSGRRKTRVRVSHSPASRVGSGRRLCYLQSDTKNDGVSQRNKEKKTILSTVIAGLRIPRMRYEL
jgi:hypothetical protein